MVTVVGAGIAGLSAAIHCRLNGHEVQILESQAHTGGKAHQIRQRGFRLDLGPSIVLFPEIYSDVFERAGKPPLPFVRLPEVSRLFMEGEAPFILHFESCLEDLARKFPRDAESMRRLLQELDKVAQPVMDYMLSAPIERLSSLRGRPLLEFFLKFGGFNSYVKRVDQWFESPAMRSFFYGFPGYGGQSPFRPAPGAFLIPWAMARKGVYWLDGGVGELVSALEALARHLGVTIHLNQRVEGVCSCHQKITVLRTKDAEFVTDHVVCACDHGVMQKWLSRSTRHQPGLSYFTLHWGIEAELPELGHHNLFLPKNSLRSYHEIFREGSFPSEPTVYVTSTGQCPPGCSNVFAAVTIPSQAALSANEMRQRTLRTLSNCGLDLGESLFEIVQDAKTFAERDGNIGGNVTGYRSPTRWGMLAPHNKDPEFQNLFYAGGSVHPGPGLPMAFSSGKFVAQLIGLN